MLHVVLAFRLWREFRVDPTDRCVNNSDEPGESPGSDSSRSLTVKVRENSERERKRKEAEIFFYVLLKSAANWGIFLWFAARDQYFPKQTRMESGILGNDAYTWASNMKTNCEARPPTRTWKYYKDFKTNTSTLLATSPIAHSVSWAQRAIR